MRWVIGSALVLASTLVSGAIYKAIDVHDGELESHLPVLTAHDKSRDAHAPAFNKAQQEQTAIIVSATAAGQTAQTAEIKRYIDSLK